ncbi:hypothetical protein IJ707_04620 [bacterium]|nr:hypothetical protein [bacterium]
MSNIEFEDVISARKYIGKLIIAVLTDKIIVREAIKKFPKNVKDASVKSAYHALIHREADEDYRKSDLMYRDEQDSYLEQIAMILQRGEQLPKNIIKNYNQYYRDIKINHSVEFKKWIKRICEFLNV